MNQTHHTTPHSTGRRIPQIRRAVAASLVALSLGSAAAGAATLDVEVAGIKEGKGKVLVALYGPAETFLKKMVKGAKVDAATGAVTVSFDDLAPGEYAVSVVHDVNDNGKMDSNALGMPTEPYGFSNDARGMFGPPAYDEAKVAVQDAGRRIKINLK